MSSPTCLKSFLRPLTIVVVLVFALAAGFAQAQTSPTVDEAATTDPAKEIAVAPDARDTQIADRLKSILNASGWFSRLKISVREGIVFLVAETETEERKEWARQLALRTQDVVAVVNRIEVQPTISWDLSPTWREIERLAQRVLWFAPLAVVSLGILWAGSRH